MTLSQTHSMESYGFRSDFETWCHDAHWHVLVGTTQQTDGCDATTLNWLFTFEKHCKQRTAFSSQTNTCTEGTHQNRGFHTCRQGAWIVWCWRKRFDAHASNFTRRQWRGQNRVKLFPGHASKFSHRVICVKNPFIELLELFSGCRCALSHGHLSQQWEGQSVRWCHG